MIYNGSTRNTAILSSNSTRVLVLNGDGDIECRSSFLAKESQQRRVTGGFGVSCEGVEFIWR